MTSRFERIPAHIERGKHRVDIVLQIARIADTTLNALILLVLVYFTIVCLSLVVGEISETRKRRAEGSKTDVR